MKPVPFFIFLAALASVTAIRAQDLSKIPPPKSPMVATVPVNVDWTITVQNPVLPPPQPGVRVYPDSRITEVHSTKTGNYKRDRITRVSGPMEELWFADSLLLRANPAGEVSVADLSSNPPSDGGDPNPSVASGFPGTRWLRLDYFDRVVLSEKRPCYHYAHEKMEAWIDVETLLPVAYVYDGHVFRFKFNTPPVGPLTLPPAYQKAFEFCQKAAERRKHVSEGASRR